MIENIGTIDRLLRITIAATLLYLALFSGLSMFAGAFIQVAAVAVALVLLATSTIRMCPIYAIVGLKTCKDC